jgi:Spherulation-specific family 4
MRRRSPRIALAAIGAVGLVLLLLPAASAAASVPTSSEHIITTLYAQPTASNWSQVESAAPTVSAAILDICAADGSGSGGCDSPNPSIPWDEEPPTTWATLITTLQGDGITPLIYIATDYADTGSGSGNTYTLSTVESEVSDAVGWWGKNIGFMFDQGATTCPLESSYYAPLYSYVKSVTNNGPVEINPGTVTSSMSCYMSAANILQVFEGPETTENQVTGFQESTFPSWMATYPARDFAATISAGTSGGVGTDVTDAGKDGIGNVYVDDEAEPPGYSALPAFWSTEVADVTAARPANPFQALCDQDGPCLNATASSAGSSVDMASFSADDQSEGVALYDYDGDYGCAQVTATCPFSNTSLDSEYLGDPLINLTFSGLSGQPVAATYPSTSVNVEAVSTAPDRDVYVLDPACGSGCAYLLSPYWTNHDDSLEALYGPPLGTQASVSTLTDNTRQAWATRS